MTPQVLESEQLGAGTKAGLVNKKPCGNATRNYPLVPEPAVGPRNLTWIRYCSLIWARSKETLCPTTNCSRQSRWVGLPALAGTSRGMRSAGDSWLVQE